MKNVVFITVLLIIGILASGCTGQPPTSQLTKDQTDEDRVNSTVPATAAPNAGSVIITLSDNRPNATLSLDPGAIVISFQAEDTRDMRVILVSLGTVNPNNFYAGTDFFLNGSYNGSLTFQVPKKGDYLMDINGWGEKWTAQVSSLALENPLKVPVNLSGPGMMVTPVFYLEKGQYIFERNKTKISSPVFFLLYANGSDLMDPNNTYVQPGFAVNSPETFRLISIPESGTYYLFAFAENNPNIWSASIIPLPNIPLPLGPGPVITQVMGRGTE
jgi:hypothetical protein